MGTVIWTGFRRCGSPRSGTGHPRSTGPCATSWTGWTTPRSWAPRTYPASSWPSACWPARRRGAARGRGAESPAELPALLERYGDEVCAVVVEPMVQAAAGMLTYDASFLRAARELATRRGALLICDEVATGIGRTGRMWASEHAGVVP